MIVYLSLSLFLFLSPHLSIFLSRPVYILPSYFRSSFYLPQSFCVQIFLLQPRPPRPLPTKLATVQTFSFQWFLLPRFLRQPPARQTLFAPSLAQNPPSGRRISAGFQSNNYPPYIGRITAITFWVICRISAVRIAGFPFWPRGRPNLQ